MIFLFVVQRLRWLARVPLFPQIFDGLLLGWTWVFKRNRVRAMELLESEVLQVPGVRPRVHRFGGMEFYHEKWGELGHVHGHGLLDLPLDKETAAKMVEAGRVRPHHVLPQAGWVSLQLESPADVALAGELLKMVCMQKSQKRRPAKKLETT